MDRASSKSLAVRGSIVKILLYLKSTLFLISSSGMIHSPVSLDKFDENTLKLSQSFSLTTFCPGTVEAGSYSSL